jgi:hypothetical protein
LQYLDHKQETTKGNKMIDLVQSLMGVKLNKRGRYVVGTLLFVAFLMLWAFLDNATTPESCKVPTEQMSQFCLDLLYPN